MSEQTGQSTPTWGFLLRVVIKSIVLFGLCNLVFALVYPMELIGSFSLYNVVFPGRERLPHAADPPTWYSVSIDNLSASVASHEVARPKAEDEIRIFLLGDSATWGWLLEDDETLATALNALDLRYGDQNVVFYNLAYPVAAAFKDFVLLDAALPHDPDAVIWLISPFAVTHQRQYATPIVRANPERVEQLVAAYDLPINPDDDRFADIPFWRRSLVGQRVELADILRLQGYGIAWAATGIDQAIPETYNRVSVDLEDDESWDGNETETILSEADFAFDILHIGQERVGDVPILFVNEPIFVSDGANSDVRYNVDYPIWAYDQYRDLFGDVALDHDWYYIDLWNILPPEEFTNTPLHYSPTGAKLLADVLAAPLNEMLNMELE